MVSLFRSIEKYGFLTPSISGLKFYSASIEYRVAMYDKVGAKVGDWNIVGYGKSEGGLFHQMKPLTRQPFWLFATVVHELRLS